LKKHNAVQVRN